MAKIVRKKGDGAEKLQALVGMKDAQAKVGWFESAKYEDGTPVAYVASIQEFGSPKNSIPPRPFMRKTISEKENTWRNLLKSAAKAIMAGNETLISAMGKIGFMVEGDIKKTITELQSPPLKASTIKARMRKRADRKTVGNLGKPLVDTGTMLATLTNVVEDK